MLYYFNEDITKTPCKAIIHGVNAKGKMASGVAKAIREKYPEAYEEYMKWIFKSELGQIIVANSGDILIGNLITQKNYGYDGAEYASAEAIAVALDTFCYYWRGANLTGIYFGDEFPPIASPKIGCGLGGLKWEDIKKIFHEASERHKIDFYIYDNNMENFK